MRDEDPAAVSARVVEEIRKRRQQETDAEAIARLAALPILEYERVREEESTNLGTRVSVLDDLVARARKSGGPDDGDDELFSTVEPWPETVEPSALLDELVTAFTRYAVLQKHASTALALWVVMTWLIDEVKVSPILALRSPEKRCGKTTVMAILGHLVNKPLLASNITPAALFRSIEKWSPTMLIDEADTFLAASDEMRGVLNSGHTRPTAYVIRTVGDDHEPKRFSTWGAKAIALIGKLADTLHDRSIVIELRRKLRHELVEPLRHAQPQQFDDLRRKLARFAQDMTLAVATATPDLRAGISDRAADNWEPLLGIAGLAGEEWRKRAVEAAKALSGTEFEPQSLGVELLADIKQIFDKRATDKLATSELLKDLCDNDERPWSDYSRGKPLNPRQLSKRLSEYGIRPGTIRLDERDTPKGYQKEQFLEAWSRYLAVPLPVSATPPQSSIGAGLRVAASSGDPPHDPPYPPHRHNQQSQPAQDLDLADRGELLVDVADDPQRGGSENLSATARPAPVMDCGGVADSEGVPEGVDGEIL